MKTLTKTTCFYFLIFGSILSCQSVPVESDSKAVFSSSAVNIIDTGFITLVGKGRTSLSQVRFIHVNEYASFINLLKEYECIDLEINAFPPPSESSKLDVSGCQDNLGTVLKNFRQWMMPIPEEMVTRKNGIDVVKDGRVPPLKLYARDPDEYIQVFGNARCVLSSLFIGNKISQDITNYSFKIEKIVGNTNPIEKEKLQSLDCGTLVFSEEEITPAFIEEIAPNIPADAEKLWEFDSYAFSQKSRTYTSIAA